MTTSTFRPIVLGIFALLLFLPKGFATEPSPEASALKVQINVPPAWNLIIDDRVSEAFVDRVRDVFYRAGFTGPIDEVRPVEDPAKMPNLLTINLTEWRINRIGQIDCTFTASLKTPRGTRELGIYSNTTMQWLEGRGRFGLSQAFVEAAEGALRDLYSDLARTELLASLSRRSPAVAGASRSS